MSSSPCALYFLVTHVIFQEIQSTAITPTELAKTISTLAQLSKHKIQNATFVGGLNCAFLAAFADWVLCLDVAIVGSNGDIMYRSQDPTNAMPQVAILLSREPSSSNQQHIFSSRIFLLPEGRSLLSERDSTINGFLWRSPWSTLLQTTFGEDLDTLLPADIGRPFTLFLAALPNLREPDLRYEEQRRVAVLDEIFVIHPMLWSYEQAGSAKFLEFACIRLPELSDYLHSAYCEINPEQSYTLGSLAMQEIEEACRCSLQVRPAEGQPDHKTCLSTLAKTIGIYLWLLCVSDIEADVCPSINGLCNLYKWQLDFEDRQERDRHKAAVRNAEKATQLATRLAKLRGKERGN